MMAGYSGTPLVKKLGIKPQSELVILDGPGEYRRLIAPLPEGVRIASRVTKNTDMVHLFSTRRTRLSAQIRNCLKRMGSATVIWVSWPKKSSAVESDVTEDVIREIALPLGLVDVKVCAVDEVWSGLKLVVRKENR